MIQTSEIQIEVWLFTRTEAAVFTSKFVVRKALVTSSDVAANVVVNRHCNNLFALLKAVKEETTDIGAGQKRG